MTPDETTPVFDDDGFDAPDDDPVSDPSDSADAGTQALKTPGDVLAEARKFFSQFAEVPPANQIIKRCTDGYLQVIDPEDPPAPHEVEKHLLALVNGVLKSPAANKRPDLPAAERIPLLKELTNWQVAKVMLAVHHVVRIAPAGRTSDREYDLLAMYQDSGPGEGTYTPSEDEIRAVARHYNTAMTIRDAKEVESILREAAPRVHKTQHPDLVAVQNGIFFYGTSDRDITINGKTLSFRAKSVHPFDPAMVFTSKGQTPYVDNAPKHVISHPGREDWEVGEWIESLSDDEGVPELLWEIIGAVLRPNVRWNKTAWFFSEQGNNGKGTLCELIRELIGPDAHTSLPLNQFGDDFALEPLMKVQAIITDENDVGTFIDKAANLKAIVTNDVIRVNRKYRAPVAYQFRGFMIQCLNEFPRAKDKSDSFYRRQLFVPFKKWFGGGDEKRYIKDDYLKRPEVLQYVLWYALNRAGAQTPGEYYELSEPPATKEVLEEYKETNDPVRFFWQEFRLRLAWELAPFTFCFDLYKSWSAQVNPSGSPVGYKQFVNDLVSVVRADPLWHCPGKNKAVRPGQRMDAPEPLIAEYDLKSWKNPTYSGNDPNKIGKPDLQVSYRGLMRNAPTPAPVAPGQLAGQDESEDHG